MMGTMTTSQVVLSTPEDLAERRKTYLDLDHCVEKGEEDRA